jgi:glucose/arabinose dehydrogenase
MKHSYLLLAGLVLASCGAQKQEEKRDSLAALPADTAVTTADTVALPPPYATESVRNSSDVIGWGDTAMPVAPAGFTVSKYAGDLDNPRWIYVLPNGDVLVAEAKHTYAVQSAIDVVTGKNKERRESENTNRILLFRDKDGDGKPETKTTFIDGLNLPLGMVLLNNYIYVANTDAVVRFPYTKDATSLSGKGEKIAELPTEGRHWTRSLVANEAGTKLYVGVGSASNVAEDGMDKEKNRACILEMNPDGSGMRVFADGLRNPVGMDWMNGKLWTAVNERDELGDDLVPDYLTSVKEGGFYGWPYSYFGQHKDPRFEEKDQRNDLVSRAIVPEVSLGAHTSSLGLAFYRHTSFPARYRNGAFIGQHGSWNRSALSGYKVVFVPFTNGKPSAPEDFLTGFIANAAESKVYGRPVGVAVQADGSLLVADDAGNTIWRVRYGK